MAIIETIRSKHHVAEVADAVCSAAYPGFKTFGVQLDIAKAVLEGFLDKREAETRLMGGFVRVKTVGDWLLVDLPPTIYMMMRREEAFWQALQNRVERRLSIIPKPVQSL